MLKLKVIKVEKHVIVELVSISGDLADSGLLDEGDDIRIESHAGYAEYKNNGIDKDPYLIEVGTSPGYGCLVQFFTEDDADFFIAELDSLVESINEDSEDDEESGDEIQAEIHYFG